MTKTARLGGALLLALLAACSGGGAPPDPSADSSGLAPIRPAPDFALETLEGDTLTMASFAEYEAVLMNFWASWCLPCKTEIPEFIAVHEAYKNQGLAVLGVTVNDLPRDSREFVEEMRVPYPSVIGTPAMLESYGLTPWLPITLLVQDGQIVKEWVGPQTRADLEYSVRVAVGLAPPLESVIRRVGDDDER